MKNPAADPIDDDEVNQNFHSHTHDHSKNDGAGPGPGAGPVEKSSDSDDSGVDEEDYRDIYDMREVTELYHSVNSTTAQLSGSMIHDHAHGNDVDGDEGGDDDAENENVTTSLTTKAKVDFLKDDPTTMTFGRRIALLLQKKYAWYNPQLKRFSQEEEEELDEASEIQSKVELTSPTKTIDNSHDIDTEAANQQTIQHSFSRRISRNGKPSLEAAWAYFEHFTLRRHKVQDHTATSPSAAATGTDDANAPNEERDIMTPLMDIIRNDKNKKNSQSLEVASPGENDYPTRLYNPLTTPLSQLGDFGFGIGLYFATLRFLTILMIIAGLVNIPNFRYFSSDEYSMGQEGVTWVLKGSAVCTVQEWVPCPTCREEDFEEDSYRLQSATATNDSTGASLMMMFALKNKCDGAILSVGMVNFATKIVVMVGILIMMYYLNRMEITFDEDEQTAQDYSIVVRNPPHDAVDPAEWRDFFSTNFHDADVACCTVVVDNDNLLHCLVKRRELWKKIGNALAAMDEVEIDEYFSVEHLKEIAERVEAERNFLQQVMSKIFGGGIPTMYRQLVQLNQQVVELSQENKIASSVFVTFEKQEIQRLVLEKMNVSQWDASRGNVNAVPEPKYLFRRQHVCFCEEPAEPSTIRWQDLHVTKLEEATKYITTGFILSLLIASYFIVRAVHEANPNSSALVISISNFILPTLAKTSSQHEKHVNEERRQLWLYIKIATFRCVNTVLLVFIITPYTSRIMDGEENLLYGVYNIFFAEIVTATLLQLLDIGGNIQRHYTAPRARTQEKMNLCMRGTEVMIAERYANMTKLVFLALWYCPLYPGVLLICAIALYVNYFADKFSLTRTWKPAPKLGSSMSKFNRTIIFPIMLIIMVFVATRSWENFTYDSLCTNDSVLNFESSATSGSTTFQLDGIEGIIDNSEVVVTPSSTEFFFCNSNGETMTDEQSRLTSTYETFFRSIAGIIGFAVVMYSGHYIRRYFVGRFSAVGRAMDQPFSSVESAVAYIPQVQSEAFAFPFLACSIDDLRKSRFLDQWNDPFRGVDFYDITKDVDDVLEVANRAGGEEIKASSSLFSKILHCSPKEVAE